MNMQGIIKLAGASATTLVLLACGSGGGGGGEPGGGGGGGGGTGGGSSSTALGALEATANSSSCTSFSPVEVNGTSYPAEPAGGTPAPLDGMASPLNCPTGM